MKFLPAAVGAGVEEVREAKRLQAETRRSVYASGSGYLLAEDRYYHSGHTWAQPLTGGRVRIGIDDFSGKIFGKPDRLDLPGHGEILRKDRSGWLMTRRGKRAGFAAPVTGKVFAVNQRAMEDPEIMLEDPYREGWLLVLDPPLVRPRDLESLYRGNGTARWMEEEYRKLLELLGPEYEQLAATGGFPIKDLFGHYPEIGWERLVSTFLKTSV